MSRRGIVGRALGRIYNPVSTSNVDEGTAEEDHPNENDINDIVDSSVNSGNGINVAAVAAAVQVPGRGLQHERQQYSRICTNNSYEADIDVSFERGTTSTTTTTTTASRKKIKDRKKEEERTISGNVNGDNSEDEDDSEIEKSSKAGSDYNSEDESDMITIVVLDSVQHRFSVKASVEWTISKFKSEGEKIHKVPPSSQRLIYRGRLLDDKATLQEVGLVDNQTIIHLFPKPRVVVLSSSSENKSDVANANSNAEPTSDSALDGDRNNNNGNNDSSSYNDGHGAHVPQIILDADEAERRSSILVLGSPYFVEAQNNVKLLSFLLLVVTSIELLNLFAILMGVPEEDPSSFNSAATSAAYDDAFLSDTMQSSTDDQYVNTDDHTTNYTNQSYFINNSSGQGNDGEIYQYGYSNDTPMTMEPWKFSNNIDFIISAFGFWVAMIGIQATNENTIRLAKRYMYGTFVVGVAWMIFNYIMTLQFDRELDEDYNNNQHNQQDYNNHNSDDNGDAQHHTYHNDTVPREFSDSDYYVQSLQVMVLPGMVWILCCVRAWQFHYLLQEAEREAQQRITNELDMHNNNISSSGPSSQNRNDVEHGETEVAEVEANRNYEHELL